MAANSECLSESFEEKPVNTSSTEGKIPSTPTTPSGSTQESWPNLLLTRGYQTGRKLPKTARDPVLIERSNLVNISRLVVKELIETSQKYGRMLDSDHLPLQHFFIVLEHVLRHGLKPKKGLLGPKKELWDILQLVEKYTPEAQDITTTVRDLPTVRTHMGRARAWLRLALMQKKLADYLKVLIDRKDDVLCEYFEPDALMMSDEALIITGLLIGLNVIDCNLCVKEEDLDCQQGVIDFSLYLRSSHHYYHCSDPVLDPDNMTTVLDQKNYVEELNRHLNATVTNLEAKVENLQTTNALMKEDLDIAKSNLLLLNEENDRLKRQLAANGKSFDRAYEGGGDAPDSALTNRKTGETESKKLAEATNEIEELKQQLDGERKKRQEVEKELKLQVSMKSEMEVAMKLLEKDIHEKQDTIISLRRQLDEIKLINLEMFKKLQDCESSLKQKTELVTKLEAKTISITETFQRLEEKHRISEEGRLAAEESNRNMGHRLAECEARASTAEGDLQIERKRLSSIESNMLKEKDKSFNLYQDIQRLSSTAKQYEALLVENNKLKELCSQHELTLEELGTQLSVSKLKVVDLQEEARAKTEGQWASDKEALSCKSCSKDFNLTRRKHHCRSCGGIFCNSCSDNTTLLPSAAKPVRVCDTCYVYHVERNSLL